MSEGLDWLWKTALVLVSVFAAGSAAARIFLGDPTEPWRHFKKMLQTLYPELCDVELDKYLKDYAPVEKNFRDVFYELASVGIVSLSSNGELYAKIVDPYRTFKTRGKLCEKLVGPFQRILRRYERNL